MEKIKSLFLLILVIGMMMFATAVNAMTNEEVMFQLHGMWKDGNYEFAVNDTYFSGWEYTVEQAYIDGPWIYAWLKMKNGGTTAVRAWKIKDAGQVYNAMIFWNASKPEPLVQPCLRVR